MTYSTETFDAIVRLAQTLRPKWDTPGVRAAIRDALGREDQPSLAELAYAVIRVAENFAVQSPAVIPMDGPHWRAPIREREGAKAIRCPRCGSVDYPEEAKTHVCKVRPKADRVLTMLETAKAEIHQFNAAQCVHKMPRALCVECQAKPAETETADATA